MAINPKDAAETARDIAAHAVEKSSDIVENVAQMLKGGGVAEGATNIVQDSLDIASHSAEKLREMVSGRDDEELPDEEQPST